MAYERNDGIAKMVSIFDKRMKEHSDKPLVIDLATIQADGSLIPDSFPETIPKSDYRICRQLSLGNTGDYLTDVTTPEGGGQAYIPEKMRKLQAGDRVLIAWAQKTAVVIDIILRPV